VTTTSKKFTTFTVYSLNLALPFCFIVLVHVDLRPNQHFAPQIYSIKTVRVYYKNLFSKFNEENQPALQTLHSCTVSLFGMVN